MPRPVSGTCTKELHGTAGGTPVVSPALEPHLGRFRSRQAAEDAHAVRRGSDFLEVLLHSGPRQGRVDLLPHLVGRLHREREPGKHSQRTQGHHHSVEVRTGPVRPEQPAVRSYHFHGNHRRGEVAGTRAVRGGGNGAAHGYVRQGRQIVQGETVAGQETGQLAVAGPGRNGHRSGRRIQLGVPRKLRQVHQDAGGIRHRVERMPGAQGLHLPRTGNGFLQFLHRAGAGQFRRGVPKVARPVAPGRQPRIQ